MTNLVNRVRPLLWPGVIGLLVFGSCMGDRLTQPTGAGPSPKEELMAEIDIVQDSVAALTQQVQASSPAAIQQVTSQRVLGAVQASYRQFDDSSYSVYEDVVLNMASVIYVGLVQESQATGKPIELLLHQRVKALADRSYALAEQGSGSIDFSNQGMVNTFAGQAVEQKAIAHVISRLTNAEAPAFSNANISTSHQYLEGLAKTLFEMQAAGIRLEDAAPSAPTPAVSREVPVDELASE